MIHSNSKSRINQVSGPSVSVVIPVKNRPDLVGRAIASALSQSYPILEVIVVDDASTDHTVSVIQALQKSDERLRLVRSDVSIGANAARDAGVMKSVGEFVAFLDSDDCWKIDKILIQVEALAANTQAVASFTGIVADYGFGTLVDRPLPKKISESKLRGVNALGGCSTVVLRRVSYLQVGGFDSSLPSCQDWDLWLRLRQIGSFILVREPLVICDSTDAPRISNNLDAVYQGHALFFKRALEGTSGLRRRSIQARHRLRLAEIALDLERRPALAMLRATKSAFLLPSPALARFWIRLIPEFFRASKI